MRFWKNFSLSTARATFIIDFKKHLNLFIIAHLTWHFWCQENGFDGSGYPSESHVLVVTKKVHPTHKTISSLTLALGDIIPAWPSAVPLLNCSVRWDVKHVGYVLLHQLSRELSGARGSQKTLADCDYLWALQLWPGPSGISYCILMWVCIPASIQQQVQLLHYKQAFQRGSEGTWALKQSMLNLENPLTPDPTEGGPTRFSTS